MLYEKKAVMTGRTSSAGYFSELPTCSALLPSTFFGHRAIFVFSAFGLLGLVVGGVALNPIDMPVLAGLVIVLLGVPHGALDVAIWFGKTGTKGSINLSAMLLRYVGLASSFFCLWLFVPALALPVFIVISIYHFSGDWERDLEFLPRLIMSAAIIAAPTGLHRAEVVEIFSWLSSPATATIVGLVMAIAAVPLLQASVVVIALVSFRRPWAAAELAAVLALAWLTPPLLFFIVYFCGLHSVRHMIETRHLLGSPPARELALAAFPYASLAIIGTLAGAVTLSALPFGPALIGTIFMALGALTVPHIVVVELHSTWRLQSPHDGRKVADHAIGTNDRRRIGRPQKIGRNFVRTNVGDSS